jgi:hypothetical protein
VGVFYSVELSLQQKPFCIETSGKLDLIFGFLEIGKDTLQKFIERRDVNRCSQNSFITFVFSLIGVGGITTVDFSIKQKHYAATTILLVRQLKVYRVKSINHNSKVGHRDQASTCTPYRWLIAIGYGRDANKVLGDLVPRKDH